MNVPDTNVVSEGFKANPHPGVAAFLSATPLRTLYLAAPVLAELRFGAARLPPSRRRTSLETDIEDLERVLYRGRILAFDATAARHYAEIMAHRFAIGRPVAVIDAQIAAVARANGMRLVTRNVRDFEATGVDLVDPFAL